MRTRSRSKSWHRSLQEELRFSCSARKAPLTTPMMSVLPWQGCDLDHDLSGGPSPGRGMASRTKARKASSDGSSFNGSPAAAVAREPAADRQRQASQRSRAAARSPSRNPLFASRPTRAQLLLQLQELAPRSSPGVKSGTEFATLARSSPPTRLAASIRRAIALGQRLARLAETLILLARTSRNRQERHEVGVRHQLAASRRPLLSRSPSLRRPP